MGDAATWSEICRNGAFTMHVITPRQAAELAISSRDGVVIAAHVVPSDELRDHIIGFKSISDLSEFIAITSPSLVAYTEEAKLLLDAARDHDRSIH